MFNNKPLKSKIKLKNQQLSAQLEQLGQKNQQLVVSIEQITQKMTSMMNSSQSQAQLQPQIHSNADEIENMKSQNLLLSSTISTLQEELNQATKRLNQEQIIAERIRLSDIENTILKQQEQHNSKINELEAQILSLSNDNESLKAKNSNEELLQQVESLTAANKKMISLHDSISLTQQQNHQKIEELEGIISNLNKENTTLKEQLEENQQQGLQNHKNLNQNGQIKSKVRELEQEIEKKNFEIENLQNQVNHLKLTCESFEKLQKLHDGEREKLKSDILALQKKQTDLAKQHEEDKLKLELQMLDSIKEQISELQKVYELQTSFIAEDEE